MVGSGFVRRRITLRGLVQGVGFRPFVHLRASCSGLTGFVGNSTAGVFIEVQGLPAEIEAFRTDLIARPPPLARIHSVHESELPTIIESHFVIIPSQLCSDGIGSVPADVGTCDDCLRELNDSADRRYRYPFVNCTHCGPRYTLIRRLPYDRSATAMAGFAMCDSCEREYHNPRNRRFHAQPIACPKCGPHVWFEIKKMTLAKRNNAINEAVRLIASGGILAVKGLGGFHLVCDASNLDADMRLRTRKGRGEKPFAVMVRDIEQARRISLSSEDELAVLASPERPIVLMRKNPNQCEVHNGIAPGLNSIGLMLPYSPLHYLLMGDRPLVMTSGNRGDEPIVHDNTEARERLADLADAFLMHDQEIHVACDDSVVRVFNGHEYPLRRSRGFAPLPVKLSREIKSVLAVGGEIKATMCISASDHAFLSQHLGDINSPEALTNFDRTADHLFKLLGTNPEVVACDLHPSYQSASWAEHFAERRGLPLIRVQHHHAHVMSLLADSGWFGDSALIACFDGTGYGTDGAIWGGEFFVTERNLVRRVGHLKYVPMPGGDAAVRKPYRMALAHLWNAGITWDANFPAVAACPPEERRMLRQQLENDLNCVPTSSIGRLFDAIASLIGIRHENNYEGQAAMELESYAMEGSEPYPFTYTKNDPFKLDPGPIFEAVTLDLYRQLPIGIMASRFLSTIANMVSVVAQLVEAKTVGLTGGVFQNITLLSMVSQSLRAAGRTVLTHRQVPCNDGGLSLGQVLIAGE